MRVLMRELPCRWARCPMFEDRHFGMHGAALVALMVFQRIGDSGAQL
jgi:hypothetical protein